MLQPLLQQAAPAMRLRAPWRCPQLLIQQAPTAGLESLPLRPLPLPL
jgi:hypothetical protein